MTADAPDPAQRLIDLESRLLHQEHLLEKLNGVVIEQAAALERLQRLLAQLREQVAEGLDDVEEPPPHY